MVERRVAHPLLPLRVVLDRNRGGSYLAVGIAGAGMFGVFLFLTYYLQQTLGFSPIETGLAFLPMTSRSWSPRRGHRRRSSARRSARGRWSPAGMALVGARRWSLLTRLGVDSRLRHRRAARRCSSSGVGLGLVFAPRWRPRPPASTPRDAGVASAMVNTDAAGRRLDRHRAAEHARRQRRHELREPRGRPTAPSVMAQAAVHGYTTAFWWSAAIFAVGAIACGLLLRSGAQEIDPDAAPVLAH